MYGAPEQRRVTATTLTEAVEQILSEIIPEHFPDTIRVTTFKRPTIRPQMFNPLEHLLEQLDEEYADPEDTAETPATPRMKEAEQAFLQAVLREYVPWKLEPDHTVVVDVGEWLRANPAIFPNARQRESQ